MSTLTRSWSGAQHEPDSDDGLSLPPARRRSEADASAAAAAQTPTMPAVRPSSASALRSSASTPGMPLPLLAARPSSGGATRSAAITGDNAAVFLEPRRRNFATPPSTRSSFADADAPSSAASLEACDRVTGLARRGFTADAMRSVRPPRPDCGPGLAGSMSSAQLPSLTASSPFGSPSLFGSPSMADCRPPGSRPGSCPGSRPSSGGVRGGGGGGGGVRGGVRGGVGGCEASGSEVSCSEGKPGYSNDAEQSRVPFVEGFSSLTSAGPGLGSGEGLAKPARRKTARRKPPQADTAAAATEAAPPAGGMLPRGKAPLQPPPPPFLAEGRDGTAAQQVAPAARTLGRQHTPEELLEVLRLEAQGEAGDGVSSRAGGAAAAPEPPRAAQVRGGCWAPPGLAASPEPPLPPPPASARMHLDRQYTDEALVEVEALSVAGDGVQMAAESRASTGVVTDASPDASPNASPDASPSGPWPRPSALSANPRLRADLAAAARAEVAAARMTAAAAELRDLRQEMRVNNGRPASATAAAGGKTKASASAPPPSAPAPPPPPPTEGEEGGGSPEQDALLRRLAESNVEITDEVRHRCEAAAIGIGGCTPMHGRLQPRAREAATVLCAPGARAGAAAPV